MRHYWAVRSDILCLSRLLLCVTLTSVWEQPQRKAEVWLPAQTKSYSGKKAREMHVSATLERANVSAAELLLPRALEIFVNVCLRNKEDWPEIRQFWQSF